MTNKMPPQTDTSRGLFWVKGELAQCLQRIGVQIESYLEDGGETQAPLERCLVDVQQIASIASVIQCYSVHLLAREMQETLQANLRDGRKESDASFPALVGATLQLSDYIDLLAHGEIDHPLVFAQSINDLRVSRGAPVYPRAGLFARFLDARRVEVSPPAGEHRKPGMTKVLAQRHAEVVQKAVLGAMRNQQTERSLQVLTKAAMQMASVAVDPRIYLCWRGVVLLAQALLDAPALATPEVQKLLAKTGQCIKALAVNGEAPVARAAGALGAQCLYLGLVSEPGNAHADSVRAEFDLAGPGLTESHLRALSSRMAAPNIDSLQTVTREIRNTLHDIKDTIDVALRSGGQSDAQEGLSTSLQSVSSTLSILGLDVLGQLARAQAEFIGRLEDGGTDEQWMQVAETLLRIEQGLESELMPTRSPLVDRAAHQDLREGVGAVLRESLINVARIKTELDHYILRGQDSSLSTARQLLVDIGSVFDLLGSSDAVAVFARVGDILVPERIASVRTRPVVADRLADVIAAAEYYVEAVQEQQPNTDKLLADVERYLEALSEAIQAEEQHEGPGESVEAAPAAESVAKTDVDPEFREIFIEESREVMAELGELLPRWIQNPSDVELLSSVRRAFHTLKGSGRMVGAADIGEFGWAIEDMLNRCQDGEMTPDRQITELVSGAVELLPEVVQRFADGASAQQLVEPIQDKVRKILGVESEAEAGVQEEVVQLFLEDATTYLAELQNLVSQAGASDEVPVDQALVRLFHSLRGGAGAAGFAPISQLAEAGERLTQGLQTSAQPASRALLQRLHTAFSGQLEAVRQAQSPPLDAALSAELEGLYQQLPSVRGGLDLELAAVFSEEAVGLLEDAESELQNWSSQPDSSVAQTKLQRIFHTLKGSARTAGAQGLGHVGEALDKLMKSVLAGEIDPIDQGLLSRLSQTVMATFNLLDEFREGRDADPSAVLAILQGESAAGSAPTPAEELASADLESEPEAVALDTGYPSAVTAEQTGEDLPAEDIWPLDPEAQELFQAEAQEQLESVDHHFAAWEEDQSALEPLRVLRRDLQSFKAGADKAGQLSLGAVAQEMESIFAGLERGEQPGSGSLGRLHQAIDGLHQLLDGMRAGQRPVGAPALLEDLRGEPEQTEAIASAAEATLPDAALAPEPVEAPQIDAAAAQSQQDLAELVDIFLPEGMELMEAFDALCVELRARQGETVDWAEMLRILHTLKGGARMSAMTALGDEVHALESRLEALVQQGGAVNETLLQDLQLASDRFHGHLSAAKHGTAPELPVSPPPPQPQEVSPQEAPGVAEVPEIIAAPVPQRAVAQRPWAESLNWEAPQDERLAAIRRETARVSVEQLDSMLNEAGEISIYRSRLERQVSSFSIQLREVEQTIVRIRDQLRMLESETDAQVQARQHGRQMGAEDADRYGEEFDPLEMDRYSRMQELTRALSESVTDLSSLHGSMSNVVSETDTLLLQQGRVNTSVQQGLMSTLMVPFSRQVQRLQRVARQTAGDNGKQASLLLDGIEAEMDRNVLERMTPVIEHVIRNCVIHGIETPEQRVAAGKPAAGTVNIQLSRDGSKLAIEIRDDGRGLDFQRIREKAIERGLMTQDAQLGEPELAQFIFQPGFSTADSLTQDAGRGVGMDVVSSEVKQLGGTLDLDSTTGQGARFVIRMPLSLAISQALLVQVADEVYAAPLATIEGIARLPAEDIDQYLNDEQGFKYGDQEYRVRYLGQLLGLDAKPPAERAYLPVILVHTGEGMGISDRRVAVVVDQLLGSRELVTKTAGPQVSTVVGVTGATIQADGRVVLILDVVALVQDRLRKKLQDVAGTHEPVSAPMHQPMVMVIDDSITMRRVAERVLTRNGYRVVTAKDGMDGIAQLQAETPDAVLLDIEMPKVDGFEVATFIRHNEQLAQVPIIMITSRSGDKHRERAAAIGVNRYLIKPYQEAQLISELREAMAVEAL